MSQLTITAFYTRKGLKIGIICLLSFIILRTGFSILYAYWLRLNPPPEPPPNVAFGKLPPVNFPEQTISIPVNFQLETVTGGLPTDLPNRGFVYYLPRQTGMFLSLDRSNQIAGILGLNREGRKITENVYLYSNPVNRTRMEINILTENFTYAYDYLYDQTLINPPPLPDRDRAVMTAQTFLGQVGKLTNELNEGNKEISYWEIRGEGIIPSESAMEADFIQVNLFRQKIENEYPIMSPNYPESLVNLLITSRSIQGTNVVEANYTHFESDREQSAEYPFISIEEAWENVEQGNYYLASFNGDAATPIKIREIYLAYFDPPQPTRFLQPIFVFEGDDGFFGYHQAITPQWHE